MCERVWDGVGALFRCAGPESHHEPILPEHILSRVLDVANFPIFLDLREAGAAALLRLITGDGGDQRCLSVVRSIRLERLAQVTAAILDQNHHPLGWRDAAGYISHLCTRRAYEVR